MASVSRRLPNGDFTNFGAGIVKCLIITRRIASGRSIVLIGRSLKHSWTAWLPLVLMSKLNVAGVVPNIDLGFKKIFFSFFFFEFNN